jgi:hypothetical protein
MFKCYGKLMEAGDAMRAVCLQNPLGEERNCRGQDVEANGVSAMAFYFR